MHNRSEDREPVALMWALSYANIQWHVLPVGDDKKPLGGFGVSHATTDANVIRGWWSRYPRAQVAVACKPSGICVTDQDMGHKPGVDGTKSLRDTAAGRPLNDDVVSSTPKGGEHIFHQAPVGVAIPSRNGVLAGVDIKCGGGRHGGYVLVPCGASDRVWKRGDPLKTVLSEPPQWLLDIIRVTTKPKRSPTPNVIKGGFMTSERTLCHVGSMLFAIPASVGRTEWLNSILAVHAELRGAIEGKLLVESWSSLTATPSQYKSGEASRIYDKAKLPEELAGTPSISGRTLEALAHKYRAIHVFGLDPVRAESPAFPISSFPRFFRAAVQNGAQAQGVDSGFWGVPLIGLLAGCVGNTRVIRIKSDWIEPAVLWTATIGPSGCGKSPPLRWLKEPITAHDHELYRQTRRLQTIYLTEHEEWKREQRRTRTKGARGERPGPPPIRAAVVDDITLEGLLSRLADNPRGLLLINDELAAWLRGFDRYRTAGGDEQTWLSIHNADSAKVDRKGGPGSPQQILIPRAAVSVVGTIQPSVAREHIGNPEHLGSGLAARLLLAQPPTSAAKWTDAEPSPQTRADYVSAVNRLLDLTLSGKDPIPLDLSDQARVLFIDYHDQLGHAGEVAAKAGDEHIAAVLSKLRGGAARIALVLALAKAAEEGNADSLREVDAEAMTAGIELARYFEGESRRLYASWRHAPQETATARSALADDDIARSILNLLQKGPKSRTELCNEFGRNMRSERLGSVLENLKCFGLVEDRTVRSGGPGRPSEVWHLVDGGNAT